MSAVEVVGAILGGIILLGGAVKAWPSVWGFVKATAKVPTMVESMVAEFSPNGGGSLRDAVDEVRTDLSGVLEWQSTHEADDLRRLADLAAHDVETSKYLHTRMHDILNALTPVVAWAPIHDKRLQAIEERLRVSADASDVAAADLVVAKEAVEAVAVDLARELKSGDAP